MSLDSDLGGWSNYFDSPERNELGLSDVSDIRQQIFRVADQLFSRTVKVKFFDFARQPDGTLHCTPTLCDSAETLDRKLEDRSEPRLRIIIINSSRTIGPLLITPKLMHKLISKYSVPPEFVPIILSFGRDPHTAEGSSSLCGIQSRPGGGHNISYQIRYVEENQRSKQDPWSMRHAGVFHQHLLDSDTFLLLQPTRDSVFDKRIEGLRDRLESENQLQSVLDSPFYLHSLLFTSYDHWRWYFRYLGATFDDKNDLAYVENVDRAGNTTLNFETVQSLRNTQDKVIYARACCIGNLGVTKKLLNFCQPPVKGLGGVELHTSRLEDYVESANVLQSRIRNTIDLIGYALNMRLQIDAFKIHERLSLMTERIQDLTLDSVDDSMTVKIVTFLSAVYLPGSFVASIFGMNFFDFDSNNGSSRKRIAVTNDFWIFFIVWIFLMLMTAGSYKVIRMLNSKRVNKQTLRRTQSELQRVDTAKNG